MTLALAMFCEGGLLLPADTRISFASAVSDAQKLAGLTSNSGMYVVAHSSADVNAANSLIGEIERKMGNADPKTFAVFESAVRDILRKSYVPVYDNRPTIQLLIGVCVQQETSPALYFCEPPNTVLRIYDNYKAIGDGWAVANLTGPIFCTKWIVSVTPC
jgi:hypothetical protein